MSGGSTSTAFPAILVVVGPTGTGKSLVALEIARRLGGEIVGCDALQVYRGFDAATAKPSLAARQLVRHHLVDCFDPRRDCTMADYVREAEHVIAAVAARGRLPIVVGGTGLYLRGLLRGFIDAPARDEALRARLARIVDRGGAPRLRGWLLRHDPASAARIGEGDVQRLVRAVELSRAGASWSERLRRSGTWQAPAERYRSLKIGLDLAREELEARLSARVLSFFAAGLVEEVQGLLQSGVPRSANAFKAIGYREVLEALDAGRDPAAVHDEVCRNTRRYAKRQRTWFRSEPDVIWLDASAPVEALAGRAASLWRVVYSRELPYGGCDGP
jgi:tRNA dimethylallyltransferase